MIERQIEALAKGKAEQPVRGEEGRLDHFVELEIGLDLGFIEIELRLAAALGVIAPIPWREVEIPALVRDRRLQGGLFAQRPRTRRRPDVIEKTCAASGVFAIVSARRKCAKLS